MSRPLSPGEQKVAADCVASSVTLDAIARLKNILDRDYDHGESEREAEEADRLDGLEAFDD